MSLFSIFNKKPPEATSVAEALAGTAAPAKTKSRRSESRQSQSEDEQLVPEKKRARRRLIGAVAIVLAVVIGLPMVLDSEPKPLSKNIVIQIPSKDSAGPVAETKTETVQDEAPIQASKPLQVATVDIPQKTVIPPAPVEPAVVPKATKSDTRTVTKVDAKADEKTDNKSDNKSDNKHAADAAPKKDSTTKTKTDSKPSDAHAGSNDEAARAMAILGGSDTTANSAARPSVRIVLQVGAFATQEKVNELQNKLSSAGIKSFTQKVATSSGDKIRVRVGPFSDRESAEKMKAQVDKLGINGSLISL